MHLIIPALVLALAAAPKSSGKKAPKPDLTGPARSLVVLVDTPGLAAATATTLQDNLKREVHKSVQFTWQEPPPVSVDELVVALSCKKVDVDCALKMAETVKADAVVVVGLGGSKTRELTILMVQIRPERAIQKTGVAFKTEEALPAAAANAMRNILGPIKPAVLEVVTTPPGAVVVVDGKEVGPSPFRQEVPGDGSRDVTVRLEGHQDRSTRVDLRAGEVTHVELALQVVAPVAAAPVKPAPAKAAPAKPAPTAQASPDPAPQAATPQADPAPGAEGGEPAPSSGGGVLRYALSGALVAVGGVVGLVALAALATGVSLAGTYGYAFYYGRTTTRQSDLDAGWYKQVGSLRFALWGGAAAAGGLTLLLLLAAVGLAGSAVVPPIVL